MDNWQILNLVIFGAMIIGFPVYFRIAQTLGIVDRPNERSSHVEPTILGSGILLIISYICFILVHRELALACILAAIVGYVDDRLNLKARVRLPLYMVAVLLTFLDLGIFTQSSWYISIIFFVVALGVINTYNFMDGINGITGLYSTVFFLSVRLVYKYVMFLPGLEKMVPMVLMFLFVFGFYNYRKKAKTFLGDAGSISLGLLVVFMVLTLIKATDNFGWILMLAVYGVDSVGTIILRLIRRENIFEAHRTHLYQDMTNIVGHSHLKISIAYALVQLMINVAWIANYKYKYVDHWVVIVSVFIPLIVFYLWYKNKHKQLSFNKS